MSAFESTFRENLLLSFFLSAIGSSYRGDYCSCELLFEREGDFLSLGANLLNFVVYAGE